MARNRPQAHTGPLSPFEGRDVVQASIKITRAGDGLSEALAVEPVEYHLGDTVHVVLECTVAKVDYQSLNGVDVLRRVHTLTAGTATIVRPELVADVLEGQRVAIEKAKGIARIPFDGEEGESDE